MSSSCPPDTAEHHTKRLPLSEVKLLRPAPPTVAAGIVPGDFPFPAAISVHFRPFSNQSATGLRRSPPPSRSPSPGPSIPTGGDSWLPSVGVFRQGHRWVFWRSSDPFALSRPPSPMPPRSRPILPSPSARQPVPCPLSPASQPSRCTRLSQLDLTRSSQPS